MLNNKLSAPTRGSLPFSFQSLANWTPLSAVVLFTTDNSSWRSAALPGFCDSEELCSLSLSLSFKFPEGVTCVFDLILETGLKFQ